MTAQTVNGVTKLLYGRGDLDLLLSSPVAPWAVLTVRALAVVRAAVVSSERSGAAVPVAEVLEEARATA